MENILQNEILKGTKELLANKGDLSPSYNEARSLAYNFIEKTGLPTKKDEAWIYTNIQKNLSPRFFKASDNEKNQILDLIIDRNAVIIFNNGIFNRELSILPEGIEIDQLVATNDFFDVFDAINFSTSTSPLSIKIKKNQVYKTPLTILHQVDDEAVNKIVCPRINIIAEPFSKLSIVEVFTSTQNLLFQYTTNASTHVVVKENAHIEHVKIQNEAKPSIHIGLTKASVEKFGQFKSLTLDLGNLTSRHNIDLELIGEGADGAVNGLFALTKQEHSDVFSSINHKVGHTTSEQLFKGILAGESHGAFTGKINIAKDAQLANAHQLNNNLMLSKKAHIDTRPQLLVATDDVKCAHGATVGQLSKEEEFYLLSRGINAQKAKIMLCHGFATDVLYKIENEQSLKFTLKLLEENFSKFNIEEMNL